MDKIHLKKLRFYGYHGVLDAEKEIGQEFIINVSLEVDLENASQTDAINDTVNYGLVYEEVKAIVENKKYDLIEKLAGVIIERIFKRFIRVEAISIEIEKPSAPVPGIFDCFSVELRRERNE